MNKTYPLDKIRQFVKRYFAEHRRSELSFHTYSETKKVVRAARKIAVHYNLTKRDNFVLISAAWFNSIGYLTCKNYQAEASADLATKFFAAGKVDKTQIELMAIIITSPLQVEDTEEILIRILLDAKFYYLGTKSCLKKIELQRKEQEWLHGKKINKTLWLSEIYEWMANYKFHTIYALENFRPGLDKNLKKLRDDFAERLIINQDQSIAVRDPKFNKNRRPDPRRK